MRTSLSRVRGLGSAKDGTAHFWRQRVTAVANVLLILALFFVLVPVLGAPYHEAVARLSAPMVGVILVLALANISYHMYLGMQIIIEDYVHGEKIKFLAVLGNIFFCALVGMSGIYAVLKISFLGGA